MLRAHGDAIDGAGTQARVKHEGSAALPQPIEREALRGNQRQSEAIGGNRRQSEAIRVAIRVASTCPSSSRAPPTPRYSSSPLAEARGEPADVRGEGAEARDGAARAGGRTGDDGAP